MMYKLPKRQDRPSVSCDMSNSPLKQTNDPLPQKLTNDTAEFSFRQLAKARRQTVQSETPLDEAVIHRRSSSVVPYKTANNFAPSPMFPENHYTVRHEASFSPEPRFNETPFPIDPVYQ